MKEKYVNIRLKCDSSKHKFELIKKKKDLFLYLEIVEHNTAYQYILKAYTTFLKNFMRICLLINVGFKKNRSNNIDVTKLLQVTLTKTAKYLSGNT